MVKYKIAFDFDIEKAIDYDPDEQDVEIIEINDECFDKLFDTKDKIKDFQDWFNDYIPGNEKIKVINVIYDRDDENTGFLEVTLESELKDTKSFASEIVDYLFEGEWPTIEYHVSGTTYEDYWDYVRSSPEQRIVEVDYEDSTSISSCVNVTITKI